LVTVNPIPNINAGTYIPQCEYNSPLTLAGTPGGGTFAGNGVNNNIFEPNNANIGSNTIIYSYTDSIGCSNTSTTNITVVARPTVTHNTIANQCITNPAFALSGGNPAGGSY